MAVSAVFMSDFLIILACSVIFCLCDDHVIEYHEDKRPCTYFGPTSIPENIRYAIAEPGLVNCSWYASNSCCKRTEVTSVFSSNMLPLYKATDDCRNRMNYLMCFFCSPDQFHWYKEGKVHVCEAFCKSIYTECKDAFYNGSKIGENYGNGTSFCEAQNFQIVNSKYCFKFDPTVFDKTANINSSFILLLLAIVSTFISYHFLL